MLKLLPTFTFTTQTETKCGEIFCHNATDFTVYCTFCEMKSFSFDEFLWHLKSLHFSADVLKNECSSPKDIETCDINKIEITEQLHDVDDKIFDKLIKYDNDDVSDHNVYGNQDDFGTDDEFCDNDCYEEPLVILKTTQTYLRPKRSKSLKKNPSIKSEKSDEDFNDSDSDGDFQPTQSQQSVQCNQCGDTFKSTKLLKSHMNRIHDDKSSVNPRKKVKKGKKIACSECDQIFPFKKILYNHIVEYHMGFKCSMCDKRFKQRQQMERHEFCHTAERVFFCEIEGCTKSFTHKYYLQRHIDSHNKERKFACDFANCNKAFHTLRCLKAHKNRHTKPKNLICDTCGYTCREYDRLRIHQRVHTGEKPYGCQECSKRFTSNAALLEHTVSHTGIRSHVCNVCNASFTRQKSLYQHRLKCTGTKTDST